MGDSAEIDDRRTETSRVSEYVMRAYGIPSTGRSSRRNQIVRDIFDPQAVALHCVRAERDAERAAGVTWHCDPASGDGTYWYFPIDDTVALCSFSMAFRVKEAISCTTPPFYCLGSYNRDMTPYFGISDEAARRTVLGYVWQSPTYTQLLRPQATFQATSVLLLPDGMKRMAVTLGCEPEELAHAICLVDDKAPAPAIAAALAEADAARPGPRTAQAYYTAKIIEVLALALDHAARLPERTLPRLSNADRSALARAEQAIAQNLGANLANRELCAIAFVSESKLARLFKIAEDTTPQGYERRLRMERARELLEQSDLALSEIARAVGFTRQGSFSEAFRERYGCTPRAYRAARRQASPKA